MSLLILQIPEFSAVYFWFVIHDIRFIQGFYHYDFIGLFVFSVEAKLIWGPDKQAHCYISFFYYYHFGININVGP